MFIPKSINKIELKENLLVIEDKELNYGTLTEDDKEVLNTMISKGSKYLPLLYLNSRYMLESVNGKRLNKIEYLTYLLECKRIKKAGVKESNTNIKPLANIENLEILEGDKNIYFGKEGKLFEELDAEDEEAKEIYDQVSKLIAKYDKGRYLAKDAEEIIDDVVNAYGRTDLKSDLMKKYYRKEYTDSRDDLKEATGYDYWGPKEMEPFEGKAFIEYYGGPGNLQYLRKARNGRWIWVDSSNPGEPYLFDSFEEALKVQEELGGEIKSYQKDWLGESFDAKEFYKYRICNDDDLIVIRKNGEVIAKGMVDNLKDNWDRFDGFVFDEAKKKYFWEYNGDVFTIEKIIVEDLKEGYDQGYMGNDFTELEDMYLNEDITAEELAEELLAMYNTKEGAEEAFEAITDYPMSKLKQDSVNESVDTSNIEEVSPEDMMNFLDDWECGNVETTFGRKLICKDGDKFVALDNSTGDAWVEEFDLNDRGYAEGWLNGKMEYEDYRLLKKRMNEEAGTQIGDIAPKEDYVKPLVKVATKKKRKKVVKEDEDFVIEDGAIKEPTNLKTPEEVLNYLKGREIIDWAYDGKPSSSGAVDYTISYDSYYLGTTDRSINAEDSSLQGLIDATFKSARNVGADISSSAADAGDFYGFETEEEMKDCIEDEEAFLFNLGREMEELTGLKNSLNEAASTKGNPVSAFLDLYLNLHDGMGDAQDNMDWAEVLADDYGLKYDYDMDYEPVLKKALKLMYEKNPKEFKNNVEGFIEMEDEYGGFDYLQDVVHGRPNLIKDLNVILSYLNSSGGSKKAIELVQKLLGNVDNLALNTRQVAEEFHKYMNDKGTWKFLGTNVGLWTNNRVDLPQGYTVVVGDYFNLLLFDKSSELEGLCYLFKDSKEEVVADLATYGYNKEMSDKHSVITMDNFKPLGTSFVITPEDKDKIFSKMYSKFKSTANQLKIDHMLSEEKYLKYWCDNKKDIAKYKRKYAQEKKEYLSTIK